MRISVTTILVVAFLAYVAFSVSSIVSLFFPASCSVGKEECLPPYISSTHPMELKVYASRHREAAPSPPDVGKLLWHLPRFYLNESKTIEVNVTLPRQVRRNGTMYLHVWLGGAGETTTAYLSQCSVPLTQYKERERRVVSLLGSGDQAGKENVSVAKANDNHKNSGVDSLPIITHWRPRIYIHAADTDVIFSHKSYPGDIGHLMRWTSDGRYLPILYIDELTIRLHHLQPVESNMTEMPLKIEFSAFSLGRIRLWYAFQQSMSKLKEFGFTEKDVDEVKGIFADTNLYFLAMTFTVSIFHLLFDFLAFKNDISYWRNRKTMVGLSSRVVLWRCVSEVIILLYLVDEQTSLLVTIPAGISCLISVWKVKKALKVKFIWEGMCPRVMFGDRTATEQETEEFDAQAVKKLSYILYPLVICGAIYCLLYLQYKSWWSWLVHSSANGVYAFGFLMMLPQLFVNYKLKSVAHLPWKVFMYKAFNTFIDDVFAFIISMPTSHRLACFRDDIVFVVFLYQRWLYPVDKSRVNEFGVSYEGDEAKVKKD